MVAIDIAIFLIVVSAIGLVVWGWTKRAAIRAETKSPHELARAVRLLDQVKATDDALTMLPSPLRSELDQFLTSYYKELEK